MQKLLGFTLPTLFLSALSSSAFATTGYFMHGYGVKAQGAAGASIAAFNDALTIANNPSGLAWLDSRVDIGATIFNPKRSAEIEGIWQAPTVNTVAMGVNILFYLNLR
jgi:long-chain fatty acid transport protein